MFLIKDYSKSMIQNHFQDPSLMFYAYTPKLSKSLVFAQNIIFLQDNSRGSIVDKHFQTKHKAKKRNKSQSDTKSPSSSPPRKKDNISMMTDCEDDSVEMMDIEIEANDLIKIMLLN